MVLDESLILYAFASFFHRMLIQNHNFSFYSDRNARCAGLIEALGGSSLVRTIVTYNQTLGEDCQGHVGNEWGSKCKSNIY